VVAQHHTAAGAACVAAAASAEARQGRGLLQLVRIELCGLQSVLDSAVSVRGWIFSRTGGTGRSHGCSRALPGGVRDRAIYAEGLAKPEHSQQHHEHEGHHQRGLCDLRARAILRDATKTRMLHVFMPSPTQAQFRTPLRSKPTPRRKEPSATGDCPVKLPIPANET